jgi:hypothetical protein
MPATLMMIVSHCPLGIKLAATTKRRRSTTHASTLSTTEKRLILIKTLSASA